jgi:uncharacterized protein (TIRG00374 family)
MLRRLPSAAPRSTALRTWLKAAISIVLLAIALYFLDWRALEAALGRLTPQVALAATLICLLHFFIIGWRWYVIIAPTTPLPFRGHLKVYFYSSFLNLITPGNLGGDAYRLLALKPAAGSGWPVFSALIQERVIGLFGYLMACAISWLGLRWLDPDWLARHRLLDALGLAMAIAVGAGLPAYAIFRRRRTAWRKKTQTIKNEHVRRFLTALFDERASGSAGLVALSLLATFLWLATVECVAAGLRAEVPWLPLGLIVVLVELIRFLPISIQGIGVREGAYAWLFGAAGLSPEAGFLVGGISYLVLGLTLVLTGALSLLIPAPRDRPPAPDGDGA